MKTVHVIFKTHLDIGFTDTAESVLNNYRQNYIPKAIKLAKESRHFKWTTGSYLIYDTLFNGDASSRHQMKEAILRGDIHYHALPFTTHSEMMDESLFEYGLAYVKALDSMFDRKTIAAKMTDVPGHTKAIVPILKRNGVEYLHLGVNPASKVPNVPTIFRWRCGCDDIIVNYASDYGKDVVIDDFDHVLHFAHTGDNQGPQSIEKLNETIKNLEEKYPDHLILASTLNDYAKELLTIKERFQIVDEEIGDTWIHGIGTDPQKVSQFRRLSNLRKSWIGRGYDFETVNVFSDNLLLVAEHTWGMDHKKHMPDYVNYALSDFQEARKEDLIIKSRNVRKVGYIGDFTLDEAVELEDQKCLYSRMEASWAEQRDYIQRALSSLDPELKKEAEMILFKNSRRDGQRANLSVYESYDFKYFEGVLFNEHGAICSLRYKGDTIADGHHLIGEFSHELYDHFTYESFEKSYNDNYLKTHRWSDPDFTKPGLEFIDYRALVEKGYVEKIEHMSHKTHDEVVCKMSMKSSFVKEFGGSKHFDVTYRFYMDKLEIELQLCNKIASRLPESLWFRMNPKVDNDHAWHLIKMSESVSPFDVVKNGNRQLHAVEHLSYKATDKRIKLTSYDAPLVCMGARNLLTTGNDVTLKKGFYFNLANNVWGTNFPAWTEGNMAFLFTLNLYK